MAPNEKDALLAPKQRDIESGSPDDSASLLGTGTGDGNYQKLEQSEGGDNKDDDGCKPCATILALPFLLIGIILYPFGLLFKLLGLLCCCCPGGCCVSCLTSVATCLTELPCKIHSCFKSIICC